jgi:DNA-binding FrmR family transcriptional regulator
MALEDNTAINHRLQTACGHLNAVICMLESDSSCVEVVQQLKAVQAAVGEVRILLVKKELLKNIEMIQLSNQSEDRIPAIQRILELYGLHN